MAHEIEITASKTTFADGIVEVTNGFLEEYFNVSRQSLSNWTKQGCPKLAQGKWDFIAVLKWRGGLAAISEDGDGDGDAYLRKIKADAFLKEQQGQIAEIELQKLRGEVITVSEVEQIAGGIITNAKGLLTALPSKVAPKLMGISALDDLSGVFKEHSSEILAAKTAKDLQRLITAIIEDFTQAESIVEINEAITVLVREVLEELASLTVDQIMGDRIETADVGAGGETDVALEATRKD